MSAPTSSRSAMPSRPSRSRRHRPQRSRQYARAAADHKSRSPRSRRWSTSSPPISPSASCASREFRTVIDVSCGARGLDSRHLRRLGLRDELLGLPGRRPEPSHPTASPRTSRIPRGLHADRRLCGGARRPHRLRDGRARGPRGERRPQPGTLGDDVRGRAVPGARAQFRSLAPRLAADPEYAGCHPRVRLADLSRRWQGHGDPARLLARQGILGSGWWRYRLPGLGALGRPSRPSPTSVTTESSRSRTSTAGDPLAANYRARDPANTQQPGGMNTMQGNRYA